MPDKITKTEIQKNPYYINRSNEIIKKLSIAKENVRLNKNQHLLTIINYNYLL